jgi:hypothetical protein
VIRLVWQRGLIQSRRAEETAVPAGLSKIGPQLGTKILAPCMAPDSYTFRELTDVSKSAVTSKGRLLLGGVEGGRASWPTHVA